METSKLYKQLRAKKREQLIPTLGASEKAILRDILDNHEISTNYSDIYERTGLLPVDIILTLKSLEQKNMIQAQWQPVGFTMDELMEEFGVEETEIEEM